MKSHNSQVIPWIPRVLSPWVYEAAPSLEEYVMHLSQSAKPLSDREAINLTIKYALAYISAFSWYGNFSFESCEEDTMNSILSMTSITASHLAFEFLDELMEKKTSSERKQEIRDEIEEIESIHPFLKGIWKVQYQLRMILDIAKTARIAQDIINRPMPKIAPNFIGLDVGTGSAKLLLDIYIKARKLGYNTDEITTIGIEKIPEVALISAKLATNLRFWKIIQGDALYRDIFTQLWLHNISFVANENLPDPIDPIWAEYQFLTSLQYLHDLKSVSNQTQYFPSGCYVDCEWEAGDSSTPFNPSISQDVEKLSPWSIASSARVRAIEICGWIHDLDKIGVDLETCEPIERGNTRPIIVSNHPTIVRPRRWWW